MNPKEQAEKIIEMFMPLMGDGGLLDERNVKAYKEYKAKQCAIISLEMLIEANPTKVTERQYFVGADLRTVEKIGCNKSHYKEVLKAIKNME